jgi:hypothetical protein
VETTIDDAAGKFDNKHGSFYSMVWLKDNNNLKDVTINTMRKKHSRSVPRDSNTG